MKLFGGKEFCNKPPFIYMYIYIYIRYIYIYIANTHLIPFIVCLGEMSVHRKRGEVNGKRHLGRFLGSWHHGCRIIISLLVYWEAEQTLVSLCFLLKSWKSTLFVSHHWAQKISWKRFMGLIMKKSSNFGSAKFQTSTSKTWARIDNTERPRYLLKSDFEIKIP